MTFVIHFSGASRRGGWNVSATADSTDDWKASQWTIPVGGFPNKVTNIGGQPVQFGAGPQYYADSPDGGPHGRGGSGRSWCCCFRSNRRTLRGPRWPGPADPAPVTSPNSAQIRLLDGFPYLSVEEIATFN